MYDVSIEYGRAVFELALEENKDKLYLEQLREINKLQNLFIFFAP